MNDQRLAAALRAIHHERQDQPGASVVRQQLLTLPLHGIPQRGRWLASGTTRLVPRPDARFLAAPAVMIAVAGLTIAAFLFQAPQPDRMPAGLAAGPSPTVSTTPVPRPFLGPHAIELEPGDGLSTGILHFTVPTGGWVAYPSIDVGIGWTLEKGPYIDMGDWARPSARITISNSAPDGMFADPCAVIPGQPFAHRPKRGDLATAVAAIPGVEVIDEPEDVGYVGSLPATYVAIRVPADACQTFRLWHDWDSPTRVAARGDTIRVWIVDYPLFELRYWMVAETPRQASTEMDAEILEIIDLIDHGG